jgi:hypothetical protein
MAVKLASYSRGKAQVRSKVLEKRALRRMFGPKRDGVTGG